MNNSGYQPAGPTTVVVVPTVNRMRGPTYLQQGVRVGGMMLGFSCVACLGLFGVFFIFSSTIMLATANYDDEFWDKFDRDNDPTVTVGSIFLVVGLILLGSSVGVCLYARKKYQSLGGTTTNQGRVINPNPGGYVAQPQPAGFPVYQQPAGYPGQPQLAAYPGQPQPAVYPGQPQPAGYPVQPQPAAYTMAPQPGGFIGQPQPYGNPGQPQPHATYAGQPPVNPEPNTSYPGPPAPYSGQSGPSAPQPDTSYPVKSGLPMDSEYRQPPPNVPGSMDAPYAPSAEPPPYRP